MQGKNISVVIICKNAANTILQTLDGAFKISDDVVVVDSGSDDGTIQKVASTPARLSHITWHGYGNAKNIGNTLAMNDWIFSLDADEAPDDVLIKSIHEADLSQSTTVFTMQRLSYLGSKPIHFGEWRNDIVTRLFNRQHASWDASEVHEQLVLKSCCKRVRLKGFLHHYTSTDIETYESKLKQYAALSAKKYFESNKKGYFINLLFSPALNFINNYILKGGFLDGKEGWQIAKAHALYRFEKYNRLRKYRK